MRYRWQAGPGHSLLRVLPPVTANSSRLANRNASTSRLLTQVAGPVKTVTVSRARTKVLSLIHI